MQCDSCDRGVLFVEKIDKETIPYAFKCDCWQGDQIKAEYPKWNDSFLNEFRPLWGVKRNQMVML